MLRYHRSTYYKILLCIVALNYAAFRVELFEDENKENHPVLPNGAALSSPVLNWETFDKNNAPEAFVFHANVAIEPLFSTPQIVTSAIPVKEFQDLVRDKSPPKA